jgi:hypothetical protein
MTPAHYVALLSAILGAAGTIVLFSGSYALEPRAGAPFGGPMLDKGNADIDDRNAARLFKQRVGLGLLCASFCAQGIAVFLA